MIMTRALILAALLQAPALAQVEPPRVVGNRSELLAALKRAKPGQTVLLKPGTYAGDIAIENLAGAPGKPIVLAAHDPGRPPVIQGGTTGLHLSRVAHVELRNLVVRDAKGNGLNIDDGGDLDKPSHHIAIHNVEVRDIGPSGNCDGIKLSGVVDFRVDSCTLERWGSGGSGIDMVGCQRGAITECTFRHTDPPGANGVQAKGGTRDIRIQYCRFEHAGHRAINLGGSTGLRYFRPGPEGFEARDLWVGDCTVIGSQAPIAFVGIDGATVEHNTFYKPGRWAFRILQETREPGFVACRNGRFVDNLIVFDAKQLVDVVNVGDATDPASFEVARNAWYSPEAPARSRPRFSIPEQDGVYGLAPRFQNLERADLRQLPESPTRSKGAREKPAP